MRHFALVCLLLSAVSACKKSTSTGGGDDDEKQPDASMTMTGSGSNVTYSLQWGPVNVAANVEDTQCIWLQLPNTASIKVHEIHNLLSDGTHHLIVYKDDMDTTEQTTPMDCQPFTGALNTTGNIAPLVITQAKDDDVVLPDAVAYTFNPNQMIKLELHYINTSDAAENIMANINFVTADPSTIMDEAAIMFTGSIDVDLPPGLNTLHQFFTVPDGLDFSQSHFFAVTGHEHHYGTGVEVNVGPGSAGPLTPVYDPTNFLWSEPPTQDQTPAFSIPQGGGFDFTCTWDNTSSGVVKFGESANDEMCFFWAYYWPSQGAKVCAHTDQIGGGYDMCCPGDPLCSVLANAGSGN